MDLTNAPAGTATFKKYLPGLIPSALIPPPLSILTPYVGPTRASADVSAIFGIAAEPNSETPSKATAPRKDAWLEMGTSSTTSEFRTSTSSCDAPAGDRKVSLYEPGVTLGKSNAPSGDKLLAPLTTSTMDSSCRGSNRTEPPPH